MNTTIVKGPDGKSHVINIKKRKRTAKKKKIVKLDEDQESIVSKVSLFHSRSRP
jgi:hypothetical protein